LRKLLAVARDANARSATIANLVEAEQDALRWLPLRATGLKASVRVDFSSPDGLDELYRDTVSYLRHYDLAKNEARFAADYACKFQHSENVKAQGLVIAEMGLVPYEGTVLREETNLAESLACFREPVSENKPGYKVGVLMSQRVPLERVFMTYMETAEMNSQPVQRVGGRPSVQC
jgi:hypothetical protein